MSDQDRDGSRADRRHPLEGAFAFLIGALPPGPLRDQDREQMARTLRDQVDDAPGAWARLRVTGRALRRLPGVLAAEWLDWLGITGPTRGPTGRNDGDGMMRGWLRNLGFAGRSLRKAPAFSLATICLVALGVGTVTTAFTVVDHVLLRPLPYPAADRLVYLTNDVGGEPAGAGSHSGATLERLDGVEAFELWTATSTRSVNLTRADGDPLRLRRMETTPDFFTLFGARPHLGRLLVDADRDDIGIAVLAYPFWRDVFGADPDVVGTAMLIDGEPIEIVGVLSEDFVHPGRLGDGVHFYRPMGVSKRIRELSEEVLTVNQGSLYPALYRLQDRGLLKSRWGVSPEGRRAKLYRLTDGGAESLREERATWRLFTGAVDLVLAGG